MCNVNHEAIATAYLYIYMQTELTKRGRYYRKKMHVNLWILSLDELTVECTVIDERAHGSINGHRLSCCWCCCCRRRRWCWLSWWRRCISFQCEINVFPFANCTVILQWHCNIVASIANGKLFIRFIRPCISLFFAIKQKRIVVLWHCAYLCDMPFPIMCGRISRITLLLATVAIATMTGLSHFIFIIHKTLYRVFCLIAMNRNETLWKWIWSLFSWL